MLHDRMHALVGANAGDHGLLGLFKRHITVSNAQWRTCTSELLAQAKG
jgi:hypothetical protein